MAMALARRRKIPALMFSILFFTASSFIESNLFAQERTNASKLRSAAAEVKQRNKNVSSDGARPAHVKVYSRIANRIEFRINNRIDRLFNFSNTAKTPFSAAAANLHTGSSIDQYK